MRISIPIAAAGGRSNTRIPLPGVTLEDCTDIRGKVIRSKAQLAFTERKFFCPDSDDDEFVYLAALSFLDTVRDAYDKVHERVDIEGVTDRPICKQDRLNLKKAEKGKVVYAKIIIERKAETVRVRFRIDNKKKIVGESETEARECLITCAEIYLRMARDFKWLNVAESEIVADARKRNEEAEKKRVLKWLNERRHMCKCLCSSGHCSPIHKKCRFYQNGMCVDVKEVNR